MRMDQTKSSTDHHVRAGSSLVLITPHVFAIVQDDANFIALFNSDTVQVTSVALPSDKLGMRLFDEKRGTKKEKIDLEACVVWMAVVA